MKRLLVIANRLWRIESTVAGAFLFFNMLLVVANVILRRFFNSPIYGSTEIIRYISLIAASLSLSDNEWVDGNIKMTLLPENLTKKGGERLILFGNIFCSFAFVLISWLLCRQAVDRFLKHDLSPEWGFPLWIFAAVLAFGFCLLTVTIIVKSIVLAHAYKNGDTIDFKHIEAAPGGEEIPE